MKRFLFQISLIPIFFTQNFNCIDKSSLVEDDSRNFFKTFSINKNFDRFFFLQNAQ